MSGIQQTLLGGSPAGGYQIERSLRFNSADSAYLNRTPASAATNSGIWTISFWCKRSTLGTLQRVIATSPNSGSNVTEISFQTDNTLYCQIATSAGGGASRYMQTTQVFRDVGAWMHFVLAFDRNQATASNRLRLYVNGTEVTAFSTDQRSSIANTDDSGWNTQSIAQYIGRAWTAANYIDSYLTEFYSIDGQQLTPSSFGETDSATGIWKPKAFSGTYGTNGFYLKFADNSNTTSTTLGKDSSGNGNNWTPNLFSVTAGAGNDSLVDTPTSYGTDTGVGGEVRGNYATLNPLDYYSASSGITFSEGNLKQVSASNADEWPGKGAAMPFAVYCEGTIVGTPSSTACVGIYPINQNVYGGASANLCGYSATSYALRFANGNKYNNNSSVAYGSAFAANDVWMMAFDPVAGKIWWGKNGTWFGSGDPAAGTNAAFTGITGDKQFGYGTYPSGTGFYVNFGQRPFAYTAPSGFKALCTQNLPTPTIGATSTTQANNYFNPVLYTGNSSNDVTVTNTFASDLVWLKSRSNAENHYLQDIVRGFGASKSLTSNSTGSEGFNGGSPATQNITTTSTSLRLQGGDFTTNTYTYVAWNWKANGAGSSNTAGSITSTVSANTTAGFSIVTSGVSTSAFTVGHGLGVAPAMMISKTRNVADSWLVYHQSLAATESLRLNTTGGVTTNGFNGTRPTSTVLSLDGYGSSSYTNVVYCFAAVAGYSAFGSYSGNNSSTDGPFVYLGFRPRFIMIKSTSAGTDWVMMDSARNTYNLADTSLYANSANSESTIGTVNDIDFLSNGFKLRNNTGFVNASQTYIYAAFAEAPFKYSLAR
jgi:hypothetical protein